MVLLSLSPGILDSPEKAVCEDLVGEARAASAHPYPVPAPLIPLVTSSGLSPPHGVAVTTQGAAGLRARLPNPLGLLLMLRQGTIPPLAGQIV